MREINYRKYLWQIGVSAILFAALIGWFNWRMDPLQFYRKASYPPYLMNGQRFQNPGFARNYPYDAVIVGTSLSENFQPSLIKAKLGWNALNFAMPGASAREQSLMLQVALRTGRVKNVLWDVHFEYLRGDSSWVADFDGTFPEYLYDQNPWNEINHYLLNIDTTKNSLKIGLRRLGLPTYPNQTLDDVSAWNKTKKFHENSVREAWQRVSKKRPALRQQLPEYAPAHLNENFDANFLKLIREHPEVKFHLYLPPFTLGYYAHLHETAPELLAYLLENRRHIHAQIRALPNVDAYDFQAQSDLTLNLNHYCDLMHFDSRVNEYIVDSILEKKHGFTQAASEDLRSLATPAALAEWMQKYGQ